MSTSALNSAISGLRIAQKALDVTATNISNANTEGYTRKTLPQESLLADGVGIGVRYGEIQRYVDAAVQRDYRTQLGVQNYYSTRESYLSRILSIQGSTDSENNISSQLGAVYDSFVGLSADPSSATLQNSVLNQAGKLVRMFNSTSNQLLTIRKDTETALKAEAAALDSTLKNIAEINKTIRGLTALGRSTAELEDQRDILVKKVAEQIDVTYFVDGENMLVLQTKDGHVLADIEARAVTFDDSNLVAGSAYPGTANGILLQDINGTSYDFAAYPVGGKIGALLELRDKEIPTYMAQLDELAHKLMMRFDDQNLSLFTDDAGTTPPNNPQLYVGLAGSIRVNAAIISNTSLLQQGTSGPAVSAGSNAVITRIVDYTFGKYKDASNTLNVAFNLVGGVGGVLKFDITNDQNTTLQSFSNSIIDGQAADYNSTKEAVANETRYTSEIQNRLLEDSAVNTDLEMTRMIDLQKNYSAAAKMISTLDELFRDLLNAV